MSKAALILMTTYNGEKYLPQQIDSIIDQTHQNWKLVIRDDGSSDSTKTILQGYAEKDPRIDILFNTTDQHGAYLNFWTLIHEAREKYKEYDYFFFADQDDVWEKKKIEIMISEAENEDTDTPLLVYADMRVIDQNDRVTYESLNHVMGIGEMSGYSLFYTHGYLWGCDICVNKALFFNVPLLPLDHPHIDIMSHDNYMGKYALLRGKIKYIDVIGINHRRHNDNTTGGYAMKLSPAKILKRAVFQMDDLASIHARVYNQSLIMLNMIKEQEGDLPQVGKRIRKSIRSGGFLMVRIMRYLGVKRKQKSRTIGIYVIALLKLYRKYLVV